MNPVELWDLTKGRNGPSTVKTRTEDIEIENQLHESSDPKNKNPFQAQYCELYRLRLDKIGGNLRKKIKQKVKNARFEDLANMERGNTVFVIGNLFKKLFNKVSFLNRMEEPGFNDLFPQLPELSADNENDEIYIEDFSGRRKLDLSQATLCHDIQALQADQVVECREGLLLNGLTVAVEGALIQGSEILVRRIILPGLIPPQAMKVENGFCEKKETGLGTVEELLEKLERDKDRKLIALTSGLEISKNCSHLDSLRLMFDDFNGKLASNEMAKILEHLEGFFVLGNSVNVQEGINLCLLGSYNHEEKFKEMLAEMSQCMKSLDRYIKSLAESSNVIIIPGEKDPSDDFIPQQPLNKSLFFHSYSDNLNGLILGSNPSTLSFCDKKILLTSGQSIQQIMKYAPVSIQ